MNKAVLEIKELVRLLTNSFKVFFITEAIGLYTICIVGFKNVLHYLYAEKELVEKKANKKLSAPKKVEKPKKSKLHK